MDPIAHNWKVFLETEEESSFSAIYNILIDDLFAYGISLGFQKESCKDAVQDIFINIYLNKKKLTRINNITGYIFRSFRNRLIDIERNRFKNKRVDSLEDRFTIEVTILDNIIYNETAAILKEKIHNLLETITPNQREAVYLKYVVGLQHKEIAVILNINEESARKLLYRAMEKLRKNVTE